MTSRLPLTAFLILILLAGNAWLHYELLTSRAPIVVWDFHPRWTGLHEMLYHGANPYGARVGEIIQMRMLGHTVQAGDDQHAFAYPLHVMNVIAPLALLPLPVAQAIWFSVLEGCLVAFAILAPRAVGWRPSTWLLGLTTLFTVSFYSTVWALILGQIAILVTTFIALTWWNLRAGRWGFAGISLALATIKPQLTFLFVPGVLLWAARRRRWRVISSFGAAFLLLCLIPMLWMPTWPMEWLSALTSYNNYAPFGPPLSAVAASNLPTLIIGGGLLSWVVYRWRFTPGRLEPLFDWGLSTLLVVSALTAPRTTHVNQLVLLLPLFFVFKRVQSAGLIAAVEVGLLGALWSLDLLIGPPREGVQHALWQHRYIAPVLPLGLTGCLSVIGARLARDT